jgi:hypothetical protein
LNKYNWFSIFKFYQQDHQILRSYEFFIFNVIGITLSGSAQNEFSSKFKPIAPKTTPKIKKNNSTYG